jgi:hypothetical protein
MKRIFSIVAIPIVFGAVAGFGAEPIKVKNWSGVQTYDVATLKKEMDSQIRKVVGVRFTFRGKDIHHMKPNWYESSIWAANPSGKGFVDLRVMVAKEHLPMFKQITTNAQSSEVLTAYGEVLRDSESKFFFVRLLGTHAAPNPDGSASVSW